MALQFFSEDIDFILKHKIAIRHWVKLIIAHYGYKPGNLNFIFVNDAKILDINKQYLKHEYFTDIITFDDVDKDKVSGDIFISIDTVSRNSESYGVTFEEELHRVIIHGVLHLTGFDDKTDDLRIKMRKAEEHALMILYSKFLSK